MSDWSWKKKDQTGKSREEKGERGVTHSREDRKVAHRMRWMHIHQQIQRTAVTKAAPSASSAPFSAVDAAISTKINDDDDEEVEVAQRRRAP
jgi:hypothetical protein